MEWVRICHIIHKYNLTSFAQEVESNFFEDVLARDVNQMQFYWAVATLFRLYVFDLVFAALSHHVIVVKSISQVLMNDLSFTYGRFTSNDNTGAQSGHFFKFEI